MRNELTQCDVQIPVVCLMDWNSLKRFARTISLAFTSIYWHHLAQNIPYESKIFFIQYYLLFIDVIHGSHEFIFPISFSILTRSRII